MGSNSLTDQQHAIDAMRQAYDQQRMQTGSGDIRRDINSVNDRLKGVEGFLKYAADVDPNFKKLLVGWRARDRIGLK